MGTAVGVAKMKKPAKRDLPHVSACRRDFQCAQSFPRTLAIVKLSLGERGSWVFVPRHQAAWAK